MRERAYSTDAQGAVPTLGTDMAWQCMLDQGGPAEWGAGVFASGGEDKLIAVWDLERSERTAGAGAEESGPEAKRARTNGSGSGLPPQLMFRHAGHRSEVGVVHSISSREGPLAVGAEVTTSIVTHRQV